MMEQTTLFIHFSQGLQHVIHVLLLQHGHHGLLQRQLLVLLQILQHADQRLVLTRLPLAYRNRHKRILGIPNVIIEDVAQSSGKEEREELVDGIEALPTVTALSSTHTKSGTSRSSTNPSNSSKSRFRLNTLITLTAFYASPLTLAPTSPLLISSWKNCAM